MEDAPLIAVFGSSTVRETDADYALAEELGRDLARAGAAVMTGGYGGIMAAVSRGAAEAGGKAIGVTLEQDPARRTGNAWLSERLPAPDLFERLRRLTMTPDGFVAVTGSLGTLVEVTLCWTLLGTGGRPTAPLVLLGAPWETFVEAQRSAGFVSPELLPWIQYARSAREAAERSLAGVRGGFARRP